MSRKLRVRPNRVGSFFGAILGFVFIVIGISVVIPDAGAFGYFWTLMAVIMTVSNFYNAASERGIASQIIEVDDDDRDLAPTRSIEARLRELDRLRADCVVTTAEYERRWEEILREI